MKVDLNQYLINKPFLTEYYRKHGDGEQIKTITTLAVATHCPVIVLAFYLAEEIGFTPEIHECIERLIVFYRYTNIVGQPPNSPFLHMAT